MIVGIKVDSWVLRKLVISQPGHEEFLVHAYKIPPMKVGSFLVGVTCADRVADRLSLFSSGGHNYLQQDKEASYLALLTTN